MDFFHSLPVPEFWEWIFSIPFPFPFRNSQMSFPLTPARTSQKHDKYKAPLVGGLQMSPPTSSRHDAVAGNSWSGDNCHRGPTVDAHPGHNRGFNQYAFVLYGLVEFSIWTTWLCLCLADDYNHNQHHRHHGTSITMLPSHRHFHLHSHDWLIIIDKAKITLFSSLNSRNFEKW